MTLYEGKKSIYDEKSCSAVCVKDSLPDQSERKTIHCVIHSVLNKNNTNFPKSYFLSYFYQKYFVLHVVDPKDKVMSFSFKHHVMKFQVVSSS